MPDSLVVNLKKLIAYTSRYVMYNYLIFEHSIMLS